MPVFTRLRNERGYWSLIGLLLGAGIVFAILYFTLFAPGSKLSLENRLKQSAQEGDIQVKPGQTTLGAVMDKSKDPVCQSNLKQIRSWIQMEQAENGQFPAALDAKKMGSGTGEILNCPLSNQPYTFNPSNGSVKCTTQGHETF